MTELLTRADGVPGAVVTIDPRLVQLLAIDLLDEEPEPAPTLVEDEERTGASMLAA